MNIRRACARPKADEARRHYGATGRRGDDDDTDDEEDDDDDDAIALPLVL